MSTSPLKQLEKRSQTGIQTLERPSLAGVDPKTARALIRLYRKELRDRKHAQQLEVAKEVGLGSVAALIYSGGQAVKAGIDGVFGIGKAIAENPDPIAQGVSIAGGIFVLGWFSNSFPGLAKNLHLDWLNLHAGGHAPVISNINDEAKADILDYNQSFPLNGPPSWLVGIANAKTIQQMPDLTQVMDQAKESPAFRTRFIAGVVTAVTGGGETALVGDIHQLYTDYKALTRPGPGPGPI